MTIDKERESPGPPGSPWFPVSRGLVFLFQCNLKGLKTYISRHTSSIKVIIDIFMSIRKLKSEDRATSACPTFPASRMNKTTQNYVIGMRSFCLCECDNWWVWYKFIVYIALLYKYPNLPVVMSNRQMSNRYVIQLSRYPVRQFVIFREGGKNKGPPCLLRNDATGVFIMQALFLVMKIICT